MTFPDRMSEMDYAYSRGVMAALFADFEPLPKLHRISRAQFKDQVRAGLRHGREIWEAPDA